jgi:limonene-1,2-epoxide hydrolase
MTDGRELVVRSFLDSSVKGDIQESLGYFTPDATYRVNAWNEPLRGIEAIRLDIERQRSLWSDFRYELLEMATVGATVLAERIDSVHMGGKDITIHAVGVFEVDDDGKITDWREYYDMKEIEAQFAA